MGPVPDFKYFSDISLDDYNKYVSGFKGLKWGTLAEIRKYCIQDCKVLYNIIVKFSENIFNDLSVNLQYTPTTSSLALRTFRSNFLNKDTNIPIIVAETYNFIKQSFTGGHVDVFKTQGKNVYHYDINSLYPFVMAKYKMPVGQPKFFEGNIFDFKDRPYGFFEVDITTRRQERKASQRRGFTLSNHPNQSSNSRWF